MGEVLGLPMAPGTVASLARQAYTDLTEFEDRVRAQSGRVPVAGFDETGFRVETFTRTTLTMRISRSEALLSKGTAGSVAKRLSSLRAAPPASPSRRPPRTPPACPQADHRSPITDHREHQFRVIDHIPVRVHRPVRLHDRDLRTPPVHIDPNIR
jgi:hypothetical protein